MPFNIVKRVVFVSFPSVIQFLFLAVLLRPLGDMHDVILSKSENMLQSKTPIKLYPFVFVRIPNTIG